MLENVHRFTHEDVDGAVIRVLDDELTTPDEFLPDNRKLGLPEEFPFAFTCCYLHHRGHHVLIDAGFDGDTAPGALESIGVAADDIVAVLLTHADRDHAAGLLRPDGSLTYPNARYAVARPLWENLRDPKTIRTLGDERGTFYLRLVRALDPRVELYEAEQEALEGIRFIPSPGHRIGHAAYEIASRGAPLLHTGDAFFHPLFVEHPEWPNAIDSIPDQAATSRLRLVERAVASGALVLASHLAFPGIGRIRSDAGAYRWEDAT